MQREVELFWFIEYDAENVTLKTLDAEPPYAVYKYTQNIFCE